MYVENLERNNGLAKMRSFHQCKLSDNKQYAMDVRWRICFENLTYFFIPWSGRKYSHTNSYNRPFYSSQRHIGNATARTWERGWGWLALNLCERFWWDSYVGSKIVRFLRKIDGPSRNLDEANFSPKKKGKQCACRFWLFKYILWPQWFGYQLLLLQVYARRHVFLLSIYRFMLILFSVNYWWW